MKEMEKMLILKKYSVVEEILETVLENINSYKARHPELAIDDKLKLEVNIESESKKFYGFSIQIKKGEKVLDTIMITNDERSNIFDVFKKEEYDKESILTTNSIKEIVRFSTEYLIKKLNKFKF
jgi:hypothetical protein